MMRIKTLLISPAGAWLSGDSPALHQAIGYPEADFDAVGFAVRNLGYIKLEIVEDVLLDLEFHPLQVSRLAHDAAQDHLSAARQPLVRLRYLAEEWRSELAVNAQQAARRFGELCAPYVVPVVERQPFTVTPQGNRRLFDPEEDVALRLLFQKWRASFQQFDDTVLPFATRRGLAEKMLIVGVRSSGDDPVFRYIGAQYWGFGRDFFLRAVGQKVRQQPDPRYGEWVAQFYQEVAATRQPRFDRIEARIEKSSRGPDYRYDRLMLPWSTPSGEVLVTVCSRFLPEAPAEERAAASEPSRRKRSRS
jgi:hypothetical protein